MRLRCKSNEPADKFYAAVAQSSIADKPRPIRFAMSSFSRKKMKVADSHRVAEGI